MSAPTTDSRTGRQARPGIGRPVRKASRSADDSYVGGVAGGLAAHLGVDPFLVRVFFAVTAIFGFGLVFYAGLWITLPLDTIPKQDAPGLEAASRQGKRPKRTRRLKDAGVLVALGAVAVGIAGVVDILFGGPTLFWPAFIAVGGLMILWRQADEAQRERWIDSTGRLDLRRVVVGDGGLASYARLAGGIGLLVVALIIFAAQSGTIGVARDVVLAGALGVVGLLLVLGPWLFRLASDLGEERAQRVRQQERADVAAHLHDSVLQTLALIQKNAANPTQVARLARAQERDLRSWMYGEATTPSGSLAAALKSTAAEVEDSHGVPVEVVTVGDLTVGEAAVPLVHATREAIVNAAKHSGAAKIDVYAEVHPGDAEVFVRDRGRGFDPDQVAEDRLGVRNSIVARMERHGGSAEVRSTPGEGTEVRLRLPVSQQNEEGTHR